MLRGAVLGGAGIAAAAVIGCGDDDEEAPAASATAGPATSAPGAASPASSPSPAAAQPKRGGVLTRPTQVSGSFQTGFDPHRIGGTSEGGHHSMFYQHLIHPDPRTLDLKPQLAQKWEQASDTEFVLTLQPGVKWHNKPPVNGREFVAGDVVFSLQRIGRPEPQFRHKGLVANIAKVEAIDKSHVKITTKTPDVSALTKLTEINALIITPEAAEQSGEQIAKAELAIGTGPFVVQSHSDTAATLVANKEYWKQGMPYLDKIELTYIKDPQTLWAAFIAGQIDLANAPGNEAKKFFDEQKAKYSLDWFKDTAMYLVWVNTKKQPYDDPRVTKALRLLVDHTEGITTWAEPWAGRGAHASYLPPILDTWDFTPAELEKTLEWKQPKGDAVKEALGLLSAAGYTKDNPLKFVLLNQNPPFLGAATELLESQFRRLGQGVAQVTEIKLHEASQVTSLMAEGDFEVAGPLPRGGSSDVDTNFQSFFHSKGGNNMGRFSDPKLDAMIEKQRTIFDVQQRKAAVKEALQYMLDNSPYTQFAGRQELFTAQKKVQNIAPEAATNVWGFQYEGVWLNA